MKKLLPILLALTFCFFSCGDDDSSSEDSSFDSSALIGKWRLDYYTPFTEDGITYNIEECEKESIYEYTEDGKYIYEHVLTIEGENPYCAVDGEGISNYSVDGNKITIIDGDDTTIVTFSITGDELTITYEDDSIDRYIKTTDPFFSETIPDENPTESEIVGNWKYTSGTVAGADIPLKPCDNEQIIKFKSDNTYITENLLSENNQCVVGSITERNYSITNNIITVTDPNNASLDPEIYSFDINEDELTMNITLLGSAVILKYIKTTDSLVSEQ